MRNIISRMRHDKPATRAAVFFALLLLSVLQAAAQFGLGGGHGQILDPIAWKATVTDNAVASATIKITAVIDDGWHLYSLDLPEDGPNATTIDFDLPQGVTLDGRLVPSKKPTEKYDEMFALNLSWWEHSVTFTQKVRIADEKTHTVGISVSFQGCDDQTCIAPKTQQLEAEVGTGPEAVKEAVADTVAAALPGESAPVEEEKPQTDWWAPVTFSEADMPAQTDVSGSPWWLIFIWGFGGGLLALLTPCVWPMIPMTVSFFLKKSKSRRRSIMNAIIYSASIIVIFLTLGIVLTLIFGPGKLNEIATGAVFNIIFFLLLVVFAISFFGAFEITLPSKWSNAVDARAESTTGILSIFFMAFTLVLVSFSCTGPIIGTLLVEAFSQSNLMGPLLGMGGFALGLALPFGLFAFFPSMLKELPRSGSWLNTVKVVLGFVELILSLKFLSVADLAYGWRILDREVFIAIWIVLFVLLGIYLLGKLRFSHDAPQEHTSVGRFFMAVASLSFAVYLVPGLWGAPLKAISAFAPPLYTQDFNLYGGTFEEFHDYDQGMDYAKAQGKPVLLDFSGYACVNCRKMEGAIFDNPTVRTIIEDNYVIIKLMVDDKAKLSTPMTVEENGKAVRLSTVGEKWAFLQRHKFGINSQPYYVLLDNEGKPLNTPRVYDENLADFVAWLEDGIEIYKK